MDTDPGHGPLEKFRLEFKECWARLPNKPLFFVLLGAWISLFHLYGNPTLGYVKSSSLFRWVLDAYHPYGAYLESDDGHGVLVPFIVGLLYWVKREQLMNVSHRAWRPGLLILAFGLLLHVAAFMVQQPKISVIAFFIGLYGLTGLAWGPAWLSASFFPYFLFVFCVPLGTQGQAITTPLRHLVAMIVTGIAHLGLAPDLVREGTQLIDGQNSFHYDVAPACSGIRSLVTLLALTTIFGFVSFRSTWKRLIMVLSAFPLAVILNVTRISVAVAVAEAFGHEAGKQVETNLGYFTFAIAIVAVLLLERWLRGSENRPLESMKESAA
jgi:exosortase